ncbi:hypothetical protein GCM10025771_29570 [Niveibacterium umoris]|uniref:HD-GYP domain-containing protein (C-di-GMP phosphodiesterase class II) n=1 Tax=Niveibacterium umoris TaxID=1193620 RepID=A0A840BFP8_9RHOO|nr:HD-GYP domain-containing protein [Niveibacterium umoris]MBB4011850.1 HD-GYP domain-containing protein (c-di-GMP phosphodiesterase class II) [Niveibacterium umoris]
MKEFLAASDLELGMFVAELDRPWIETPFLLQGFVLESEEQLQQIRALCRIVMIDRERSDARHHQDRQPVAPEQPTAPRPTPLTMVRGDSPPPDFFQLLRLLKSYEPQKDGAGPREGPVLAWVAPKHGDGELGAVKAPKGERGETLLGWLGRKAFGRRTRREDHQEGDAAELAPDLPYPIDVPLEQELLTAAPIHAAAMGVVRDIMRDVERQLPPNLGQAREVVQDMMRSVTRHPDALLWLTRLKRTDRYTYDHALDCCTYAMVFARHLGLPEERIAMLGMAGLLWDVGKLRLSARLLAKDGPLTPLEYEIFRTHVDSAVHILRADPDTDPLIVEIVARHHERIDGSGYPAGLVGDVIGVFAEMAGIVDSFCAMTRHRSWRPAVSTQQGLESLITLRGKRFSPELIDQFIQCIGIYPAGTLVELNSGEVAVVIAQNRVRRLKPRVMVLLSSDHSPNSNPHTLDLLYDPPIPGGSEPYRIVRSLPENAFGIDPAQFYLA